MYVYIYICMCIYTYILHICVYIMCVCYSKTSYITRYHALLRIAGHVEVDEELVKGCSKELVPWSTWGFDLKKVMKIMVGTSDLCR